MRWSEFNPFHVEHRRLVTRLTPEECAARITALWSYRVEGGRFNQWLTHISYALAQDREIPLGQISSDGFVIVLPRRRRSFLVEAVGKFVAEGDDTDIHIDFGWAGASICAIIFALGFISSIFLLLLFATIFVPQRIVFVGSPVTIILVAVMMLTLILLGARSAWNDVPSIMAFLCKTLEAREVESLRQ